MNGQGQVERGEKGINERARTSGEGVRGGKGEKGSLSKDAAYGRDNTSGAVTSNDIRSPKGCLTWEMIDCTVQTSLASGK